MQKKKILMVDDAFSPIGGAEIIAYKTYKLLQEHGHDVYFWASNQKPYFEENYEYSKFFTKYNGGIKNYIKNPIKYYYNYQAKRDLQKFIDYIHPDLIHFHNVQASLYSCSKNIPSVLTIHGTSLFCPAVSLLIKNKTLCKNHLCKKEYFFPCIFNKCAKNSLEASIRRALLFYINNKQLKYIDKFITPSRALMELDISINQELFKDKITTINNFIDGNMINAAPNFYSNKGYFLYVGRLIEDKGIMHLLKAIEGLSRDIMLRIVGTGPQEEALKIFVKKNSMNNVKFLGFKNENELQEEYQNCIATVIPSIAFDNFPTVTLESYTNGKPVIASSIGGIPEQVEHNITGLLFEPSEIEQLKECILKYWNNRDLIIEHGKNAYKKAITQYTKERYYNELTNVYDEVFNNARK